MDILVADKLPQSCLHELEDSGHRCTYRPELAADELVDAIAGHDCLIVRSTRVTAATIASSDRLALVIRAGAGTNTIDTQAAADRNVRVCNVPGQNAIAVAELTMGLLLCIDRNIADNVFDLRRGRWDKKRYSEALGLFGRNIGIVGLGAVGMAVAERAVAFGLRIHALRKADRPDVTRARLDSLGTVYVDDIGRLAECCDILSFHVPATATTRQMVDAALLARLKPGAVILNTSRGDIVDEDALIKAMDEKGIRAGLDVYANEPGGAQATFESALARHPNVYGTHHIGASTSQAQAAVARRVLEIVDAFGRGDVLNCVNM